MSQLLLRDSESDWVFAAGERGLEDHRHGRLIIADDVADMSRANGLLRRMMRDKFETLPIVLYLASS